MTEAIDVGGLVRPQVVEKFTRSDDPNIAEFRIQPLERGYGHTLGNAMRRMLLSSLRGAAVWGFRVDGVLHEHQTISGVVEDVHQIIGNLKTLILNLDAEVDSVILRASRKGAGSVTAEHIQEASGVTVVDRSQHILTLTEDRELIMELYVNKGRGYVEADQHPVEKGLPIDLVRIDSIYNPVRRANFSVSETRVGQRTDYDRLTLIVETDGTISPEEAVSYAAALTQTHFQYFADFGSHTASDDPLGVELPAVEAARLIDLFSKRIDEIGLTTRTANAMKNIHTRNLGELLRLGPNATNNIKGFGKKSLKEVLDVIDGMGLKFAMRYKIAGDKMWVFDWGMPADIFAAHAALGEDEEVTENATP
jgi:DNA-directed RNA polymerase subunit alpha